MNLAGGLVPLDKARPSQAIDDEDEDFDALLGDILDSPTSPPIYGGKQGKSKKKNPIQRGRRNSTSSKKGKSDFSDSFDSFPSPAQGKRSNYEDPLSPMSGGGSPFGEKSKDNLAGGVKAKLNDSFNSNDGDGQNDRYGNNNVDLDDSILGLMGAVDKKKAAAKSTHAVAAPSISSKQSRGSSSPSKPFDREPVPSISPRIAQGDPSTENNSNVRGFRGGRGSRASASRSPDNSSPSPDNNRASSTSIPNGLPSTSIGRSSITSSKVDFDDFADTDTLDLLGGPDLTKVSSHYSHPQSNPSIPHLSGRNTPAFDENIDPKPEEKVEDVSTFHPSSSNTKDAADEVDLGFIPSFLEAGRQPRQRRQLGIATSKGSSGHGPKELEELDKALGIGGKSTAQNKANPPKDPFATVSNNKISGFDSLSTKNVKISGLGAGGPNRYGAVDSSDSSSTDDNSRKIPITVKDKTGTSLEIQGSTGNTIYSGVVGLPALKSTIGQGSLSALDSSSESVDMRTTKLSAAIPKSTASSLSNDVNKASVPESVDNRLADQRGKNEDRVNPSKTMFSNDAQENIGRKGFSIGVKENELSKNNGDDASKNNSTVGSTNNETSTSNVQRATGKPHLTVKIDNSAHEITTHVSASQASTGNQGYNWNTDTAVGTIATPRAGRSITTSAQSATGDSTIGYGSTSLLRDESVSPSSNIDFSKQRTSNPPAWLTGTPVNQTSGSRLSSSSSSNISGSGIGGSPIDGAKEAQATIRSLQQKLEQALLEKESVERQLRLDIDALKAKLSAGSLSSSGSFSAGIAPRSALYDEQIREFDETKEKLLRSQAEDRRTIAHLELEISRLKDEATLQTLHNQEETKLIRDRYNADTSSFSKLKEDEITSLEKRHSETIAALKKIHLSEIETLKDRFKDGQVLQQLTGQLTTTSGSIKLIEEQLSSRYKGIDAVKESQMEARERLLQEMENEARKRADIAEAEGYRLKGLLLHMEHVVNSMRSQTAEEKERLKMEHHRLQALQTSLEAERTAMQIRIQDDLNDLKTKKKDLEEEFRRFAEERRLGSETILAAQQSFEADKAEFASYIASSTRAAETTAQKLKEEEDRLVRLREEVCKEKQQLELRKVVISREIQESLNLQNSVIQLKEDMARERQELQRTARELQLASESIAQHGHSVDGQSLALSEREEALREGMNQMKIASLNLTKREHELQEKKKYLETEETMIMNAQQEIYQRNISGISQQRQLLGKHASTTINDLGNFFSDMNSNPISSMSKQRSSGLSSLFRDNHEKENNTLTLGKFSNNKIVGIKEISNDRINSIGTGHERPPDPPLPLTPSTSSPLPSAWLDTFKAKLSQSGGAMVIQNVNNANPELQSAKRVLHHAKTQRTNSSSVKLLTDSFLQSENDFLSKIKSAKGGSGKISDF